LSEPLIFVYGLALLILIGLISHEILKIFTGNQKYRGIIAIVIFVLLFLIPFYGLAGYPNTQNQDQTNIQISSTSSSLSTGTQGVSSNLKNNIVSPSETARLNTIIGAWTEAVDGRLNLVFYENNTVIQYARYDKPEQTELNIGIWGQDTKRTKNDYNIVWKDDIAGQIRYRYDPASDKVEEYRLPYRSDNIQTSYKRFKIIQPSTPSPGLVDLKEITPLKLSYTGSRFNLKYPLGWTNRTNEHGLEDFNEVTINSPENTIQIAILGRNTDTMQTLDQWQDVVLEPWGKSSSDLKIISVEERTINKIPAVATTYTWTSKNGIKKKTYVLNFIIGTRTYSVYYSTSPDLFDANLKLVKSIIDSIEILPTIGSGSFGNPLQAMFLSEPSSGSSPLTVQFTDRSLGNPQKWAWDFGDGYSSAEKNPSYTYLKKGLYTVELTVSNEITSSSSHGNIDVR
jgi:hypothetical protein